VTFDWLTIFVYCVGAIFFAGAIAGFTILVESVFHAPRRRR
jgi:hypothetical protein